MFVRYTELQLSDFLHVASFIDPRFKSMAHLTDEEEQHGVIPIVIEHAQKLISSSLGPDGSAEVAQEAEVPRAG